MGPAAFEFGRNWQQFSRLLDEERIEHATTQLQRLLGVQSLEKRSFFDIGCGSGLHSLAALRLGAARVLALAVDEAAVQTAQDVLFRHWNEDNYVVEPGTVLDLDPGLAF